MRINTCQFTVKNTVSINNYSVTATNMEKISKLIHTPAKKPSLMAIAPNLIHVNDYTPHTYLALLHITAIKHHTNSIDIYSIGKYFVCCLLATHKK